MNFIFLLYMAHASWNFILVVISILLIVLTYIFYYTPHVTDTIIKYVPLLTLVIFLLNVIITLENFRMQSEDRLHSKYVQKMGLKQNRITDIDKMFMNDGRLDRLYYQMYSHDPNISNITTHIQETPEIVKAEHHVSNIIFQKIEDIFRCENLNNLTNDNREWITTFKNWMKSPILKKNWNILKHEHHPDVIQFVDKHLILA